MAVPHSTDSIYASEQTSIKSKNQKSSSQLDFEFKPTTQGVTPEPAAELVESDTADPSAPSDPALTPESGAETLHTSLGVVISDPAILADTIYDIVTFLRGNSSPVSVAAANSQIRYRVQQGLDAAIAEGQITIADKDRVSFTVQEDIADEVKPDEVKPDEVKPDEVKVEEVKVEEVKVEEVKVEEAKPAVKPKTRPKVKPEVKPEADAEVIGDE